jgi:DNA-binding CsgD family transcriptional regulator
MYNSIISHVATFTTTDSLNEHSIWQLPFFMVIKDVNSKFLAISKLCANLVGFSELDDAIDITDYDLKCGASESADIFRALDKSAIDKKQTHMNISINRYADGNVHFHLGIKNPLINNDGKITGTSSLCLDMDRQSINNLLLYGTITDYNVAKSLGKTYSIDAPFQKYNLSKRESECLFYWLRGKTAKDIAAIMQLSPRTIETFLDRVKNKLGCFTKAEVFDKAHAEDLFSAIPSTLLSNPGGF